MSSFLRLAAPHRLIDDVKHRRGFLHRLDVPTSGLILVATDHKAYYDLQLQLAGRELIRDYVVLCHGFLKPRGIDAPVHWVEDAPEWFASSRVLASGKPAKTRVLSSQTGLKAGALKAGGALSLASVRISTGRRHQIRVHVSHVGHPTVSDGRYSAAATFRADLDWCPRNFLHRYRLSFFSEESWAQREEAPAPAFETRFKQLNCYVKHSAGRFVQRSILVPVFLAS